MKIGELDSLIRRLPASPRFEGEDEYLTSVVLLLLIPIDNEFYILFEKRAASIRQGGEISLPGGRANDHDASLQEAALRETTEEVGIPSSRVRIIGRLNSILAPMGALVHVFVGISDVKEADIHSNLEEVEKAFLTPVSFFQENPPEMYNVIHRVYPFYDDEKTRERVVIFPAKELGLPERYWNSWGGFKHNIYVYRNDEGTIWGITARIIRDFVNKL